MNQEAHENLEIPWSGSTRVTEHSLCDTQIASDSRNIFWLPSEVQTECGESAGTCLLSVKIRECFLVKGK